MPTANDIVLRPRFKMELNVNNETILKTFELEKKAQSDFIVSRIDDWKLMKLIKTHRYFMVYLDQTPPFGRFLCFSILW